MKPMWILTLITLFFLSCEFDDFTFYAINGEARDAVCKHKAVMAALVYSEHYPTRIVHGPTNNEGLYHCQAQAYIDGEWHYLQVAPIQILVVTGEKDNWYTIEEEYTLEDYLHKWWLDANWSYLLNPQNLP